MAELDFGALLHLITHLHAQNLVLLAENAELAAEKEELAQMLRDARRKETASDGPANP